MNPPLYLRDFSRKAEMLGFVFVGMNGNGHPKFYNADVDELVTTSSTPSDWRSHKNCLARMERLSGRKLPRENAGHHRHMRVAAMDTRLTATERESLERIDVLLRQAGEIEQQWLTLIAGPANRTAAGEARELLDGHERIRRELAKLHRIIPPLAA